MDLNVLKKYHEHFSLITVSANKRPNFAWSKQQKQKLSWEEFLKNWNYKGGIIKKDGEELPATDNFGIVTGYEDLECLDIDLKVLDTAQERREFWEQFLKDLRDNIYDFDEKFVIYKTMNAGYHILYRSKLVEGNKKLAKPKGKTEALAETRGVGGYIFVYHENKVSKRNYFQIPYITDEEREIVMSFARMYNYEEIRPEIKPDKKVVSNNYDFGEVTPWDDYNEKTDIFDVIGSDFTIVKNLPEKYVIKRHGAKTPYSGYVYKNSGCMFLFSTATIWEAEKLWTPFSAYAMKFHFGDYKAAAKDLYQKGFGSRMVKKEHEPDVIEEEIIKINQNDLIFPIEIFPKPIQGYLVECSKTLDSSIDYMGCSLLWLISISIGNSMQVEVKRGWREIATVWIAIVGKAGIGKTPSINNVIHPLEKINNKAISDYIKEAEQYEEYATLTKKEKDALPPIERPQKKQFIANDITIEALIDLHQQSDNALGVFKDELAGWFKDMNKYKQGSDLEFWLSSWSGKAVNVNRVTRVGSFVPNPLISVLGGIQPTIFSTFYTDENKENGFVDRILMSYPELKVETYNDQEMKYETLEWYYNTIVSFFQSIKRQIKRDENNKIIPTVIRFDAEAKKEWIRIFNEITTVQNSEDENEYMKSMLPKQKSYIPRFAMLIHVFNCISEPTYNIEEINKDSMLKAEKLSKYFIAMAKKIKVDSHETHLMKSVIKEAKTTNPFEAFKKLYNANKNIDKNQVAELLGVSVRTIYKYIKKIDGSAKV